MLLISLVIVSFLTALYIILFNQSLQTGLYTRIRETFLKSVLLFSFYIIIITEALSYFHAIKFWPILFTWSLSVFFLVSFILYKKINIINTLSKSFKAGYHLAKGSIIVKLIVVIFFISFFIAISYPTNNYDSLTYHMARVAHWIQNGSIENYCTHIIRQLIYPPFAEWCILHVNILTDSDTLSNAVQLFFLLGCLISTSLIAKELSGNFTQQLLTMMVAIMIPMVIIQSNTTQNDIVNAFFVSSFVYFTLKAYKTFTPDTVIFAGIALGISWLTKGTAYIFTFPFCLWYVFIAFRHIRSNFKASIKKILICCTVPILAIGINSGFYFRNIELTGSPLGNANVGTGNDGFNIPQLLLVGIKNTMNHMPVRYGMKKLLTNFSNSIGLDINDPKYHFTDITWMKEGFSFNEDYAQNFVHVILIIAVACIWIYRKKPLHSTDKRYITFTSSLYSTLLLFTILLKWQPWSNRLETPIFLCFAAAIGLELEKFNKSLKILCIVSMVGFAAGALLWSSNHRLLPIKKGIFRNTYDSYIFDKQDLELANYIDSAGYMNIGLYIGPDSKDYVYYKLLRKSNFSSRKVEHIKVINASEKFCTNGNFDVIIYPDPVPEQLINDNVVFKKTKVFSGGTTIYSKVSTIELNK